MPAELEIVRLRSPKSILDLYPEVDCGERAVIAENVLRDWRSAKRGERIIYGVRLGGRVVGTIQLVLWRPEGTAGGANGTWLAQLHHARVDPEFRGYGIGTRLIKAALAEAKRRGFEVVTIGAEPKNFGAIRLYHRLGFRRWLPYRDARGRITAYEMRKRLRAP